MAERNMTAKEKSALTAFTDECVRRGFFERTADGGFRQMMDGSDPEANEAFGRLLYEFKERRNSGSA